ncbi:phage tail protein [Wolbachia endosymbiont (group A) of Sicus ferrugineus]|uniref:phage tail protein n=1 Tax=Wolbachia endosymbiont (group A) of Sicus ferrugineus TaxID=2954056 RepID=UPI00222EAA4E|nr:phage tail protein [Wolbachia endosymbiont (group A) of Sicus ferrugineus]
MFNIEVNENIERIIHNIDANKAKIELAAVIALNKTASWLKAQATKEISEEKRIKLTVIRKRLRVVKANRNTLTALVRANLYDVKVSSIGRMKQGKKGAEIGKYQITGAFIATMPRGYKGAFKREGKTALPIKEVKLPLEPEASRIIENFVNYEVEEVFEKFFESELSYITRNV